MENYKITLGLEPSDKYTKAKQDLLQTKKSFDELNSQEKERLVKEMFGVEAVEQFWDMIGRRKK